jgi:hypothetical protein
MIGSWMRRGRRDHRRRHADDLERRDQILLDRGLDRAAVEARLCERPGGRVGVALGKREQQVLGLDLLGAEAPGGVPRPLHGAAAVAWGERPAALSGTRLSSAGRQVE